MELLAATAALCLLALCALRWGADTRDPRFSILGKRADDPPLK